jgi:PTS system mannose-specific IIA component
LSQVIGIVIVAHGGLAAELKRATEHVVGSQAAMIAISIGPEDDRAARTAEICDAADAVDDGDGVIVVTDMYGGSPSNLSLRACRPSNRLILTGVNLPMMIKLAKSRHLPVGEAVARAAEAGRRYINSFDAAAQ